MIMLKDNHIWASGSITTAVKNAKAVGGFALKIEVECQSEVEAEEAILAGADIVMLDNMTPSQIAAASKSLKKKYRGKHFFLIEASGGLTEDNCVEYFCPDVDVLSFGSLTQSVSHVDFSLKVVPK
jgi:nicotinate-nucleotide pyrophosphorylase (carboxylating)